MPMYVGYSSINANKPQTTNIPNGVDNGVGSTVRPLVSGKKFVEYDEQLILQDLVNALNIPKGSKVGQPAYGTNIWDFIFILRFGKKCFLLLGKRRLKVQSRKTYCHKKKTFHRWHHPKTDYLYVFS